MALFFSSTITLIFIEESRVVRCEVDVRRQTLRNLRVRNRRLGSDLTSAVELALQDGGRVGKVWILAADLWTQKVAVAGSTLTGLSPTEAARALAFEAESLSGISAFESEVGFASLGGSEGLQEYWVTQIARDGRERIEQAVREKGGRFAGILHPAGVPAPLDVSVPAETAWTRLESWPGINLGVMGVGEEATYRIINPERRGQSRDEQFSGADAWQSQQRLASEAELSQWLLAWGLALERGTVQTPLIRALPQPLGKEIYIAAAAMLAMLMLGVVFVDRARMNAEITSAEQATLRLRGDETAWKNAQKESESLRKKTAEMTATNERMGLDVSTREVELKSHRERWSQLLRILAERSSADLVIQELNAANGAITVRGLSLGTQTAMKFSADVAAAVRPYGWLLTPSQKVLANSNLYEFSWQLAEATPLPSPALPPLVATKNRPLNLQPMPPRGETP